uniref:Anaphase-promoting complex subunit 4 WD40 domain-containing protein n=1 Tax=Rhodosorus marinus TaxID=101924 RepID=A0A7S2ZQZ4_9RHOD|eukprot:CAMPEP_0113964466 /NCGR_PEP_ID=MMETSP0011_2-20120614/7157_1 /TAXON_ID=101924 /ORGANISM="Rhodosorus marinus" /LENGTH=414 /DNA_ID=CAMNT_0000976775 /DNA_START=35 /DNA_END=1279 /DNA_ORIENTATION=- /assembly_acc=CAM_ASM_000156
MEDVHSETKMPEEMEGGIAMDEEDVVLDEQNCEVIELNEGDGVNDQDDMDEDGGEHGEGSIDEQLDDDVEPEADDTMIDLEGHTESVFCVVASPSDNNVVASGGGDDRAIIHNLRNNKVQSQLEDFGDSISAIAFSQDGKLVAFGGMNGRIVVVDVATGKPVYEPEGPAASVEWLDFHSRGNWLVGGSSDAFVYMWNEKGENVMVFSGHATIVSCGGFSPDGRSIVTGSEDGTVRIWNPKTGECVASSAPANSEKPGVLCMDMMDNIIIVGYEDGSVRLVSLLDAAFIASLPSHAGSVESVKFAAPGLVPRICASAGMDGTLRIWDMDLSRERTALEHGAGVVACKWHQQKPELIISASVDRKVHVWDARKGEHIAVFLGNRNTILSMDIGLTGEYVVTASDDHHVRVFNLYQG